MKLSQSRPQVPTGAKLSLADKSRVHTAQTYVPMRSPGTTLTVPDPGRPSTSFLPSCSSHSAPTTLPLTTPPHPHASHVLPVRSHCSEAAQVWLKGCLLPLGGIPSPPYLYQESKPGSPRTLPSSLPSYPRPPTSVTEMTSMRAGPVCGLPHLQPRGGFSEAMEGLTFTSLCGMSHIEPG